MKFTDILKALGEATPQTFEDKADRRDLLKTMGMKAAAIAAPIAVGSFVPNKASAKTTDILAEAMVFLLGVGYIQKEFYTAGLGANGLIPAVDVPAFQKILKDKVAHIKFWTDELIRTNNAVPAQSGYDFTALGALPKTLTDYNTYLTVAHAMEDAGVRIYLTGVDMFATNKGFRGDAINIGTVNARHAAHVRLLKRNTGVDMMPWVAGTEANSIVGEIKKAYQKEDNTIVGKINTVGINGFDISFNAATEAFDVPMPISDATIFLDAFTV